MLAPKVHPIKTKCNTREYICLLSDAPPQSHIYSRWLYTNNEKVKLLDANRNKYYVLQQHCMRCIISDNCYMPSAVWQRAEQLSAIWNNIYVGRQKFIYMYASDNSEIQTSNINNDSIWNQLCMVSPMWSNNILNKDFAVERKRKKAP